MDWNFNPVSSELPVVSLCSCSLGVVLLLGTARFSAILPNWGKLLKLPLHRNGEKHYVLYVQKVVTLQKKMFSIFASENEAYNIY